ncbi:hypothetical protein GN244_ATG05114 [Phytophthora infestans]|uniref:Uncharacterized protein n=1 Tax=Phytophthora infestans TaxID=4787 RepID=A0A833TG82_PHYIN|nr:hypothetical protein GN244_ATG05114 [Phytophthora infestans]KAF4139079.1 hypothetical protein GN958_ATG11741 [Phytophthora infestans]
MLDGQPFYLNLTTTAFQDTSDFEHVIEPLAGLSCFGDAVKHVVYGGTKEEVTKARYMVVVLAEITGIQLSESGVPAIRVADFKLSADGILRREISLLAVIGWKPTRERYTFYAFSIDQNVNHISE